MGSYKIEALSFSYPGRDSRALDSVNLTVNSGEFVTICGKSGCGKTTLMRLLKPSLAPHGVQDGCIYFSGTPLSELSQREQTSRIGFVMQSCDNQIVTDKVWHELAFGLESLGYSTPQIRARVSEMASFFGIQTWFHQKVSELSGGQKQLLNLASVMVMQPSVLLLDEPTSQLDPIAASEFLKTLKKINLELGTTVIMTEHRLEEAFPLSDRAVVMDGGRIIADAAPEKCGEILKNLNHDMYSALPAPMRIWSAADGTGKCPLTVRDGRCWLESYAESHTLNTDIAYEAHSAAESAETVIEIKDAHFKYGKNEPDVIKGLNAEIKKGEFFAILGGNGAGKTTALTLMSGINEPYRGKVKIRGTPISEINSLYSGILGVLPQNPQTLFVKKTVYLDLMEMLQGKKLTKQEKEEKIKDISELCRIDTLLESHPYDLSGGEQQRAALAKVLLLSPEILLLDEPTKGMDAHFKEIFACIVKNLLTAGTTVVMVSHDIEFCAQYADRCALFFDGGITSVGSPREFFAGKSFYTTSANRMARTVLPSAVLAEDIIAACGGIAPDKENSSPAKIKYTPAIAESKAENTAKVHNSKKSVPKIIAGIIFALMFVVSCICQLTDTDIAPLKALTSYDGELLQIITIAELSLALLCLLPKKELGIQAIQTPPDKRKLLKRTLASALIVLLAIPLTIFVGIFYLGDRKYYFISLLIILEILIPFAIVFESRKPKARELIVISVLCAIAVAGRSAFFMLPQFKPTLAIVIISGLCFGGEAGFLVGAVSGFVSNFFFGQGPWTQWQMFGLGIVGFLAGVLFRRGLLRKTRASLSIFGALAAFVIYGGIVNTGSAIMMYGTPTREMLITTYLYGIPYDLIHAVSTAFFMWFAAEPMIDKTERIKIKYGLPER